MAAWKTRMQTLLLATVLLLLTACHTFHASAEPKQIYLARLPSRSENVVLVMDSAYRSYEVKDRGHWMADPQTYKLGDALVDLTERYFDEVFGSVKSVSSVEDASNPSSDLIVTMRVDTFDNDLDLGFLAPATQHLTLGLSAEVAASGGETREFSEKVKEDRIAPPIGEGGGPTEVALGLTIQKVLVKLLESIDQGI